MIELTEKQKELILYVKDFIDGNGYSPSKIELGQAGFGGIDYQIRAIVKKGYINSPSGSRTLNFKGCKELEE